MYLRLFRPMDAVVAARCLRNMADKILDKSTSHCPQYMHDARRHGHIWQVEGLNIPMSVGPPAVDKDNAGQECIVYDVIINPKARPEEIICLFVWCTQLYSSHNCSLPPLRRWGILRLI